MLIETKQKAQSLASRQMIQNKALRLRLIYLPVKKSLRRRDF